jgi:hypothetical protein
LLDGAFLAVAAGDRRRGEQLFAAAAAGRRAAVGLAVGGRVGVLRRNVSRWRLAAFALSLTLFYVPMCVY